MRLHRHAAPPVAVADPERMFALVRAGFATRRKMLRRALDADARRPGRVGVRGCRASIRARGPRRSRSRSGPRSRTPSRPVRAPEARVDAFAKLTLSLHVTGTRADGYHDLDALVVPVSEPHDELVIRPATTHVDLGDRSARRRRADRRHEPGGARRARARRQRQHRAAQGHPARRRARRRIGRRGRGARRARPASPGSTSHYLDVERIAATLGADVPFCLRSGGAMRMRGIGDDLEPVHAARARGRDRDAAVRLRDRRRVPRVGRRSAARSARPSRSTVSRRCATTSNRPRTTWSRGSSRSRPRSSAAAGARAARGQRIVVRGGVPQRRRRRGGAGAHRRRRRRSDRRRASPWIPACTSRRSRPSPGRRYLPC